MDLFLWTVPINPFPVFDYDDFIACLLDSYSISFPLLGLFFFFNSFVTLYVACHKHRARFRSGFWSKISNSFNVLLKFLATF